MKKSLMVIGLLSIFIIAGVVSWWMINRNQNAMNQKVSKIGTNVRDKGKKTNNFQKERDIKVLSRGTTTGYFEKIEWGDYCHFDIKDPGGKSWSFFVYMNYNRKINFDKYEKDPSYKGKKVKVSWQEIETYIPEGGSKYKILELINIEDIK